MVNGKKKGSNFERKVARLLTQWCGVEFHRTPGSGSLHWGKDTRVRGDIVPPIDFYFPFSVEVKKHEGWSIEQILNYKGEFFSWWGQCVHDALETNKTPLLVFSKNRSPIYFATYSSIVEGVSFLSYLYLEKNSLLISNFEELIQYPYPKIIERMT